MTDITQFLYENVMQEQGKVTFGETYYLPPPVYCEFATGGNLNYARISTKYEVYCSFAEFIAAVESVFGTRTFGTDANTPSDITKADFLEKNHSVVFKDVRDWQYAVFIQKQQ